MTTSRKKDAFPLEALSDLAYSAKKIADAITPVAAGNHDETGGFVCSLTEAVMGVTAGLCKIADAINNLAEAIRERE